MAEILRGIVRIRLAGQEDRAHLTNEYLTSASAAGESFEGDTSEIEERIQQYLDFNAALLAKIAEYQSALRIRLESIQNSLAEQQAAIDRIEQEAQDIATPAEGAEENTEGE